MATFGMNIFGIHWNADQCLNSLMVLWLNEQIDTSCQASKHLWPNTMFGAPRKMV